jgi:hypothetical protein
MLENNNLSTVVRIQKNLFINIPSINNTPKTFQNEIANTAEIINAAITVIIMSTIARFTNLYARTPYCGLPSIFLYGQPMLGPFLQGQSLLLTFLQGQSLHGGFLHGHPMRCIMYYGNIFISKCLYFLTCFSINNMQSIIYNTTLIVYIVIQ